MNAPPAVMDEELSLAALLDLCSVDEPEPAAGSCPAPDQRSAATVFLEWTREWTRRATAWGAGPQGSWRAW